MAKPKLAGQELASPERVMRRSLCGVLKRCGEEKPGGGRASQTPSKHFGQDVPTHRQNAGETQRGVSADSGPSSGSSGIDIILIIDYWRSGFCIKGWKASGFEMSM